MLNAWYHEIILKGIRRRSTMNLSTWLQISNAPFLLGNNQLQKIWLAILRKYFKKEEISNKNNLADFK